MKKYRKRPLIIEAAQWDGEKLGGQLRHDWVVAHKMNHKSSDESQGES